MEREVVVIFICCNLLKFILWGLEVNEVVIVRFVVMVVMVLDLKFNKLIINVSEMK